MSTSMWILGFAGSPRPKGGTEWDDTFIGGLPVFPGDLNVSIPLCPLCSSKRVLVLQAFAPHAAHPHREIYLFGCNSIRCSNDAKAWFALRLCKNDLSDKGAANGKQEIEVCKDTSLAEGDSKEDINWDTDSESHASTSSDLVADLAALTIQLEEAKSNAFATAGTGGEAEIAMRSLNGESQGTSLGDSIKDQPNLDEKVYGTHTCLQSYYVEVMEEPKRAKPLLKEDGVDHLLRKYEEEENARVASGVAEAWGQEREEDESADAINFEAFQERISRAPEQILRYGFNCDPIWSKYPPPGLEPKATCKCGSPLVFEVQVLGSCLHYLQPDKSLGPYRKEAGMNFAAVAIYTCEEDCTSSEILASSPSFKIFRQAVVVQQDEW